MDGKLRREAWRTNDAGSCWGVRRQQWWTSLLRSESYALAHKNRSMPSAVYVSATPFLPSPILSRRQFARRLR
jgi:hypothetical protein